MFKEVEGCPIILKNGDKVEEGFYKAHGTLCYVSPRKEGYYIQYPKMSRPVLLENGLVRKISAKKINLARLLQNSELSPEVRRFIGSKLTKLIKSNEVNQK